MSAESDAIIAAIDNVGKLFTTGESKVDPGSNKGSNAPTTAPGGSVTTPRPAAKDITNKDIDESPAWNIPNPNDLSNEYYNWVRARMPFTPEAEWNKDLVRGDRSTNVSGRDPKETERLSRLADKLNNRVRLGPADIGHRTFTMGTDPIKFSQMYQMPKIETEETRQMDRMRQYEATDRQRDIARQNDYKELDRLWAQMRMIELQRREGRMSDAQADMQKAPLMEQIRRMSKQWDTTNEKHIWSWQQTVARMDIPMWQANMIYKMAGNDPIMAEIIAGVFNAGAAPDMMNMLRNSALREVYQNPNLSSTEKLLETAAYDWNISLRMAERGIGVGADEWRRIVDAYNQSGKSIPGMLDILQGQP